MQLLMMIILGIVPLFISPKVNDYVFTITNVDEFYIIEKVLRHIAAQVVQQYVSHRRRGRIGC